MKHIYFTAGPSQIYPSVPKYIKQAIEKDILSMSHRGEAFQKLFQETQDNLRNLLNIPKENHIFFVSSANEAWERIIQNCAHEHTFHLVNGAFGKRLYEIAGDLKKTPVEHTVAFGEGFEFNKIVIPQQSELVCITHNESSTGVALNIQDIHTLKKRYPEKLFALDTVSSMPYVNVDYSLIDAVYFSVQKGFGLPAGLGVLILTPQAMEKSVHLQEQGINIGSYHNFPTLLKFALKNQTPETPNVLDIYLLNKIAAEMLNLGIEKIRKQTDQKANLLYKFFENNKRYRMFVQTKKNRSNTVLVVKTPEESIKIIEKIKKLGYSVGKGYGPYKTEYIRIANFPAHKLKDVKKMIQYLNT